MKNSSPLKLIGFLAITAFGLSVAHAQTPPVTTDPVGFIKVTCPSGATTSVGVPISQNPVDVGALTSVDSATQVSNSAGSWGNLTSSPNLLQIVGGTGGASAAAIGRYFIITANTATQLTVNNGGVNLTTLLAAGNNYKIIPAYTLATLFPGGAPFKTGTSSTADNLYLRNDTGGWDLYYHNGTNWKKGLGAADNTPIYPDDGFLAFIRGPSVTLSFAGTVPMGQQQTQIPGLAGSFISNRFPTDTTLLALGIQTIPNWSNANDAVYIRNAGGGWDKHVWNGTNWKKGLGTSDTTPITAGTAILVSRASASGSTDYLSQAAPY